MGKYKIKNFKRDEINKIESTFKENLLFIGDIVSAFPHKEDDDNFGGQDKPIPILPARLCPAKKDPNKPAKTIEELNERLNKLKGKLSLGYKDKLLKKGIKNRLKKKEKKEMRRVKHYEEKKAAKNRANSADAEPQPKKPVFNSDGQMVFSKFDFSELGAKMGKKSGKGVIKDPSVKLKKVKEQDMKLKQMEEDGMKDKVKEIKEKMTWKSALMKSEGVKVRDNPELLKASIKRMKKSKEKSQTRWKANQKKVEKVKEERQQKRMANIQARAKQKKLGKMKKQAKKGRLIAGF